MALLSFLPMIAGLIARLRMKTSPVTTPTVPNMTTPNILQGQQRQVQILKKMRGRGSTNLTGGLLNNPLLARGGLWPL